MMTRILDWLWPPLPVLKVMPRHVEDLPLDIGLLCLSMDQAHRINPAVQVGFIKPRENGDVKGTSE